jgi:hypothetical protein
LIDVLLPFASDLRNGKREKVLPTVEQVTGRKPLTFVEWAREYPGAFV